MTGFKIRTLTKTGEQALRQCLYEEKEELRKKSIRQRLVVNKLWNRSTTESPLTDSWILNVNGVRILNLDPKFSVRAIAEGACFAMEQNGAVKDSDFLVEVDE